MMIAVPLAQLLLFGYAINTDPRRLPTAVLIQDGSAFARSYLGHARDADYFEVTSVARSEAELDSLIPVGTRPVRGADSGPFRP